MTETIPIAALNIFVNHFYVYLIRNHFDDAQHTSDRPDEFSYVVVYIYGVVDGLSCPLHHHDTDKVSTTTFDAIMEKHKYTLSVHTNSQQSSANTGIRSNGKEFGAMTKYGA